MAGVLHSLSCHFATRLQRLTCSCFHSCLDSSLGCAEALGQTCADRSDGSDANRDCRLDEVGLHCNLGTHNEGTHTALSTFINIILHGNGYIEHNLREAKGSDCKANTFRPVHVLQEAVPLV